MKYIIAILFLLTYTARADDSNNWTEYLPLKVGNTWKYKLEISCCCTPLCHKTTEKMLGKKSIKWNGKKFSAFAIQEACSHYMYTRAIFLTDSCVILGEINKQDSCKRVELIIPFEIEENTTKFGLKWEKDEVTVPAGSFSTICGSGRIGLKYVKYYLAKDIGIVKFEINESLDYTKGELLKYKLK